MRISDWSSDVCSSDLPLVAAWHDERFAEDQAPLLAHAHFRIGDPGQRMQRRDGALRERIARAVYRRRGAVGQIRDRMPKLTDAAPQSIEGNGAGGARVEPGHRTEERRGGKEGV